MAARFFDGVHPCRPQRPAPQNRAAAPIVMRSSLDFHENQSPHSQGLEQVTLVRDVISGLSQTPFHLHGIPAHSQAAPRRTHERRLQPCSGGSPPRQAGNAAGVAQLREAAENVTYQTRLRKTFGAVGERRASGYQQAHRGGCILHSCSLITGVAVLTISTFCRSCPPSVENLGKRPAFRCRIFPHVSGGGILCC